MNKKHLIIIIFFIFIFVGLLTYWSKQSKEKEKNLLINEQLSKTIIPINQDDYPLSQFLPYENEDFRLTYLRAKTILIVPKREGLTPEILSPTIENWVEKNGIDPKSHYYTYIINQ